MAVILSFAQPRRRDWSSSELAEFMRATAVLRRSGLPVISETGASDEGEPWVIFLREDTGDVVAHIARIDGQVIASSAATDEIVSGPNFRAVMDRIIQAQPLVLPQTRPNDRVLMHPATVMVAFVATALLWAMNEDGWANRPQWKIGEDGALVLQPPARDVAAGSLLRDGVLSKAELGRLSGDSQVQALTAATAWAAAAAAVTLMVTMSPGPSDDTLSAALADFGQSPEADDTTKTGIALAGDTPAWESETRTAAAVMGIAVDSGPAWAAEIDHARGPFETALATRRDEQPEAMGVHSNDHLSEFATLSDFRDVLHGNPIQVAVDTVVVEAPRAGDPAEIEPTDRVALHHPAQPLHGASFVFAADASELLTIIFGQALAGSTITVGQDLEPHVGINTLSQGLSQTAAGPEPAPQAEAGYRLLDDIRSFAFDSNHEVSPSERSVQALLEAFKALAYMPEADRVVIIDVPNLRADAFVFSDGIIMISQDMAEKYLPDLAPQTQTELTLANGEILKLMGVIDLDQNPAATFV